jgi:hypothetical protein
MVHININIFTWKCDIYCICWKFFSQIFIVFVVQIFKMEEMLHVLIYNIAEEVEELSFTYVKY